MPLFRVFLLSALAGAIYPLGFAPFGLWPLAVVSVGMAFALWTRLEPEARLLSALIYGMCAYLVGVSWVYVSMVNFGNMAPVMAVIAVVLFALILALYQVLLVFVFGKIQYFFSAKGQLLVVLPAMWVVLEWLRSVLFTGFPWLTLGYAGTNTWFSSAASLSGVLAVSYLFALFAGLAVWTWRQYRHARKDEGGWILARSALLILLITLCSWFVQQLRWSQPTGQVLDVTLIQADIPLSVKWKPENRENIKQTYLAASRAVEKTDLIIWPEGALPLRLDQMNQAFLREVDSLGAPLILGTIDLHTEKTPIEYYNSLVLFDGDSRQIYRKQHLVPFGEFFPLQWALGWLFDTLQIPMSDFSHWLEPQENITVKGVRLLPTICYEDAFPEDWRSKVSDANLIINISEDAWFGDSFGPHQRLQMAKMRTIETARPMIRISNSGLSTVIDEKGQVDAVSPQFQPALFNSPVFPMAGDTPYTRFGYWPLWVWLAISLVVSAWRYKRHRNISALV